MLGVAACGVCPVAIVGLHGFLAQAGGLEARLFHVKQFKRCRTDARDLAPL